MPLMSLGLFAFSIQTAPFETIKRTTTQRWESKNRVGVAAANQHVGPGDDTITIDGTLAPQITGGPEHLDKLREMMASGKVWILTAGTGEVLGKWFITSVDETRTHMLGNGVPRKLAFTLTLKHYPDDDAALLGKLLDSQP
ncbi:MAG: phage tail protein [Rhodospirillaceae bacterium]|nr:phage tail protein [Rhodospirillales bacterium]